ncbi:MAG: thioredoxin [Lentisphaerae bacterium]|nr:thioredoxin [Lentisphaerota bacterium]
MSAKIIHLSKSNWVTEVQQASLPVVVDFWAAWCGPCKILAATLNEVATELAGKIKIAKVNVEENPELAAQFQIRSLPTLLVFKGGTVQEQMVGALRKDDLLAKLKAHL